MYFVGVLCFAINEHDFDISKQFFDLLKYPVELPSLPSLIAIERFDGIAATRLSASRHLSALRSACTEHVISASLQEASVTTGRLRL
jgi:hypothetical protein